MKPAPFSYHAPTTVEEAVAILARVAPEDGRVLAGGQSLVPTMAFRLARPRHLVDINGVEELKRLAVEDGKLCIGAGVRHAAFHKPPVDGPLGRLLSEVVRHIAHHPIRARGTFCGSIAHADPASDLPGVLVALGATVHLKSAGGERSVAAGDFFTDLLTTDLRAGELITAVEVSALGAGSGSAYLKVEHPASGYAVCGAAAWLRFAGGQLEGGGLAFNGVAASPGTTRPFSVSATFVYAVASVTSSTSTNARAKSAAGWSPY